MARHKKNHVYNREKVYAVYRGDKFLTTGTWYEILKYLKISESTLRYYLSESYYKRFVNVNKRLVVIPLEELDGLEEVELEFE